mmetsp:Transcript_36353/g.55845  ORF Transcript_36353/g.55845 Transcript_36353/m.55845 type:complete len:218 (+) Transcript_36353:216-869(+)
MLHGCCIHLVMHSVVSKPKRYIFVAVDTGIRLDWLCEWFCVDALIQELQWTEKFYVCWYDCWHMVSGCGIGPVCMRNDPSLSRRKFVWPSSYGFCSAVFHLAAFLASNDTCWRVRGKAHTSSSIPCQAKRRNQSNPSDNHTALPWDSRLQSHVTNFSFALAVCFHVCRVLFRCPFFFGWLPFQLVWCFVIGDRCRVGYDSGYMHHIALFHPAQVRRS